VNNNFQDIQRKLAVNLRRERRKALISQEELAFKADIDRTYASQIERGIANPSLKVIYDLSKALNCKPEDLIK
jgi:transcriptional regulator with XRE-family HTH domain